MRAAINKWGVFGIFFLYEIVYVICKTFRIFGFRPHFTYYVCIIKWVNVPILQNR
jgi:hypothetical protein